MPSIKAMSVRIQTEHSSAGHCNHDFPFLLHDLLVHLHREKMLVIHGLVKPAEPRIVLFMS